MKAVITLLLVGGMGAGGTWLHMNSREQAPAKVTAPPVKTAREIDVCRDTCEQNAIMGLVSEDEMRACRARCDGKVKRPYEPIRSITVAPADHRPTAAPKGR